MIDITPNNIRDVFSYSQKYNNKTFIIYIDEYILSGDSFHILVRDIVYMLKANIKIIIVPGIYSTVHDLSSLHSTTLKTMPVVSNEAISTIQKASFDVVGRIITHFARYRQTAVLGNWTLARSYGVIDGIDYKNSGYVEKIDVTSVNHILQDDVIPIFPAIGWSYIGTPYYLNPIDVAMQASINMHAFKLIFLLEKNTHEYLKHFDISQLEAQKTALEDSNSEDAQKIRRMTIADAHLLLQENTHQESSMIFTIIQKAVTALENGIERTHILDGSQDGSLLTEVFFNTGVGLMIYSDEYDSIVPMKKEDALDVFMLMKPLIQQGILKTRTIESLIEKYADFFLYKTDGHVRGVAALHRIQDNYAEIAGLATTDDEESRGIGKKIVEYLLARAKKQNYKTVFVFTLKTGDWFERLGFRKLEDIQELPRQRLQEYIDSRRQSRIYIINTDSISNDILTNA